MKGSRSIEFILACAGIAAIVFRLLPVFTSFGTAIPSTFPDSYHFLWNFWWIQERFSSLSPHIYSCDKIYFPFGANLLMHTLTEGISVIVVLLAGAASPLQLYSIFVVVCFLLNFIFGCLFFFEISRHRLISFLASLALTFHPFFSAHLDGAHLNFLPFFLVLGALISLHRLWKSGTRRWSIAFAVSVSWLAYTNLYYFYDLVILGGAAFLLSPFTQMRKRTIRALLESIAMIALLCGHHLYEIAVLSSSETYSPNHNPAKHSADLLSFIIPGPYQVIQNDFFALLLSGITLNSSETGLAVGFSLVVLTIFIACTKWRSGFSRIQVFAAVLGLLFFALSLGPAIDADGARIASSVPYRIVSGIAPFFPSVPARFGIFLFLGLLVFSLSGMKAQSFRTKCVSLVLFVLLCVEFYPVPLRMQTIQSSPALDALRVDSSLRIVHDAGNVPEIPMLRQIFHGKTITGGYLARRPLKAIRSLRNNPFVSHLEGDKKNSDERTLLQGWEELGADALIIDAPDTERRNRISSLPWLHPFSDDGTVAIYRR